MKAITVLGIVLIVLGLGVLAYKGITYTSHDTIVDIGPIHATAERQKTIPISPIVGIVALVGGGLLVAVGARSRG
jgi:drug/metabolite transporter (DMT)-like permease